MANETKLTAAPKFAVGDSVITPDGKKVVSSVWLSPRGFYWVACVNEAGSFAGHNEYKEAELQPAPVAASAPVERLVTACDCGCTEWLPIYEDDYPIVDHWECASCHAEL